MREIYVHFAGKEKYERRPYYLLESYCFTETDYSTRNYRCSILRLGRSFISPKAGINTDLGIAFPNKETEDYFMGGLVLISNGINLHLRL